MLKGYIGGIEPSKTREDYTDYLFTDKPENASKWDSKEQAEIDRTIWNKNGIEIPSSQGGNYVCKNFKIEEIIPNQFLIFCEAPFIPKSTTAPR
jgi:hypothetical protein